MLVCNFDFMIAMEFPELADHPDLPRVKAVWERQSTTPNEGVCKDYTTYKNRIERAVDAVYLFRKN